MFTVTKEKLEIPEIDTEVLQLQLAAEQAEKVGIQSGTYRCEIAKYKISKQIAEIAAQNNWECTPYKSAKNWRGPRKIYVNNKRVKCIVGKGLGYRRFKWFSVDEIYDYDDFIPADILSRLAKWKQELDGICELAPLVYSPVRLRTFGRHSDPLLAINTGTKLTNGKTLWFQKYIIGQWEEFYNIP